MGPIFGPNLAQSFRPPKVARLELWLPKRFGPPKVEQSIRALARIWLEEVGGANLVGQGWWREEFWQGGGGPEEVGGPKGPAEPGGFAALHPM